MTELKAYWPEAYSYLLSQLENQRRIKGNPHLIRGIVKGAYQNYFKANYDQNDGISLYDIVEGEIKGKRTCLSRIVQDKPENGPKRKQNRNMLGVLLSRQDESCPKCVLGNFCERSYVASFLLLSPETLFVAYNKPNPELISCHTDFRIAKIKDWKNGERLAAYQKLNPIIEKGKLIEGLELADMVYDAYMHFKGSKEVTEEIERLKGEFYKDLLAKNLGIKMEESIKAIN